MGDPISETLAIAAMPGLEEMAEHIDRQVPAQRRSSRHTPSILILAATARAFRSQERAASAFRPGGLWERAVASAGSVGRQLPSQPPSPDQLDRWLRHSGPDLAVAAEESFNRVAVDLAQQLGLLRPDVPFRLGPPDRAHHLTADGTVAKPLSTITEENALVRSRAADPLAGARICNTFVGKPIEDETDPDNRPIGLPFSVLSTHAGRRHLRIMFGFEPYQDGNETGASMRLFDRVLPLFDGGAHTLHYDRLMQDRSLHQIARRHGVLSIVEMRSADSRARMGVVPDEGDGRFRRGRYQQYEAKPRLRGTHYGLYQHEVDGRPCRHRLFSIDGQLVGGFIDDRRPTTDMPALDLLELERERHSDRWSWNARFALPCPNEDGVTLDVDLAQQPLKDVTGGYEDMGNTDMKPLRRLAIGRIRPINERHTVFWDVAGRRSDSESTIATIKRTLPHNRASRLRLSDFHLDLIGAGLWSNAKAWDVHLAQHTEAARQEHRRQNPKDRPNHAPRAARQVA